MTAILTGDLINSGGTSPGVWLPVLKKELNELGKTPAEWEIFRGDSFQLHIPEAADALWTSIKIKAALKRMATLDVRIAIGIGAIDYHAAKITESNGSAFIYSGKQFEQLKVKKQNLALQSPFDLFDREMNLYLRLALHLMDHWTANAAEMVHLRMEHPSSTQKELGALIGIRQNTVSERLKRAAYDDIMDLIDLYRFKLSHTI